MATKGRKTCDWLLLIFFVLTGFSGIKLHVINHENSLIDHQWFLWAWMHGLSSLVFTVLAIIHLIQHSSWYKVLNKKNPTKKLRVRKIAIITTDTLFGLLLISGIWLLLPFGEFVLLGKVHYILGLLAIVFGFGHILKRLKMLK
ncbi:MAG: hypothetical protein K2O88_06715 [Paramuribaculum sp.]|nr:hypothetical protein [Paramuribaculum sp.]